MNSDLVKRRDEAEQEEDTAFAKRVKNFVDMWDGELSKVADVVEFLAVCRDANITVFLGNDDQRVRERRSRLFY